MFLFRLALRLGRTVDELLNTISYRELMEWMELASFDPFDERRSDLRNAMLMSLLANQNRDKKKRPQPFGVDDFLPFKDVVPAPKSTGPVAPRQVKLDPRTLTYMFVVSGARPGKL